jgi:hypothetical protein
MWLIFSDSIQEYGLVQFQEKTKDSKEFTSTFATTITFFFLFFLFCKLSGIQWLFF